jgi:hypothetical protein
LPGNLAQALWGFNHRDIPNTLVPFMKVQVDETGSMEIKEGHQRRDLLVGLSRSVWRARGVWVSSRLSHVSSWLNSGRTC